MGVSVPLLQSENAEMAFEPLGRALRYAQPLTPPFAACLAEVKETGPDGKHRSPCAVDLPLRDDVARCWPRVIVNIADNAVALLVRTITNSNITGNAFGLRNVGSVDTRGNWWNDPSGPSGLDTGSGDADSANVLFSPWSSAPIP